MDIEIKEYKMIKGVFHIHSEFSYDSNIKLEDLRKKAKEKGLSFIILTEHIETLLENKNRVKFEEEIFNYIGNLPLIIPGVEYSCDNRTHLISIGNTHLIDKYKDPFYLIEKINENNDLVIWAHYDFKVKNRDIEIIKKINGIEIWNRKYDGKFSFLSWKGKVFNYLKRKYNKDLKMYCGLDLHTFSSWTPLYIFIENKKETWFDIKNNLKNKKFFFGNYFFTFNSDFFSPSFLKKIFANIIAGFSFVIIKIKNIIIKALKKMHINVPMRIKEFIKKIL